MISIARLGQPDADRLDKLNRFFGRVFPDPDVFDCEGASDAQRQSWLANDGNVALVAEVDGAIVGGIVAYRFDKIEGRSEYYLYDLAVAEEHRRKGIATDLIARLRAIAEEQGAWVVYVQADQADGPAVELYSKLGKREDVLHFDIDPRGWRA